MQCPNESCSVYETYEPITRIQVGVNKPENVGLQFISIDVVVAVAKRIKFSEN